MASRFEAAPGLEAALARMVAAKVQRAVDEVADAARPLAPGTKKWVTRGDGVVRKEHRHAGGQEVPENLRFVVDTPAYDRAHYGAPARQQLREPRDPTATPGLTERCRCEVARDPAGLARHIRAGQVVIVGGRVVGRVTAGGPRVVEAEFGNDKDQAARFLGRAARLVAARLRSRA